jgi:hypothetical protein
MPITQLAFDVTCRDCGAGLTIVNPGGTCGSETKVIVACVDCGAEWAVLALMRPLHRRHDPSAERANGRIFRSKTEVAGLVEQARLRVDDGESVRHACMAVGVDRRSYYARHPAGVS